MSKEITIAGEVFTVSVPYAAGHVLTEGEAKALNQTRCENIRNNMATVVKKAFAEGGGGRAAAEAEVVKYDSEYAFTLSQSGPRRVVDPLERECYAIAKAHLLSKLKEQGAKLKDQDPAEVEAKLEEWSKNPKVVALAKKNLASRKDLTLE